MYQFVARRDFQMVCITNECLRTNRFHFVLGECAYCCARRNGNECGCFYFTMRGRDNAKARSGFTRELQDFEFEHSDILACSHALSSLTRMRSWKIFSNIRDAMGIAYVFRLYTAMWRRYVIYRYHSRYGSQIGTA